MKTRFYELATRVEITRVLLRDEMWIAARNAARFPRSSDLYIGEVIGMSRALYWLDRADEEARSQDAESCIGARAIADFLGALGARVGMQAAHEAAAVGAA